MPLQNRTAIVHGGVAPSHGHRRGKAPRCTSPGAPGPRSSALARQAAGIAPPACPRPRTDHGVVPRDAVLVLDVANSATDPGAAVVPGGSACTTLMLPATTTICSAMRRRVTVTRSSGPCPRFVDTGWFTRLPGR